MSWGGTFPLCLEWVKTKHRIFPENFIPGNTWPDSTDMLWAISLP